ncbi:T9SS type A sorting domain-containing protein [Flavivirga eckloniae]|uniref:Secretion system C-terminal sorting domain-containing protein n=1 Tax=Flavivirga eckloniae TaxID=1803846 RepID=A0A2K9PVZ8_9FLAO|nr:T9SS type A sorting domain-containing protein [Flavivirga eckloniae]AUP81242.1 hypothetical protein C1H87_21995 [Flavivirga eckloniae]
MKKKLQNLCLTALTLFTALSFGQNQITFDFSSNTSINGTSVSQTVLNQGVSYQLTATHNFADADLWGDVSGENTTSGKPLFFAQVGSGSGSIQPEIWTVILTKDGQPCSFNLSNISFEKFCGLSTSFSFSNNLGETMVSTTIPSVGAAGSIPGSTTFAQNNIGIESFTIRTTTFQGTQCTDFGNIILTPAANTLSAEEVRVAELVSNVYPNPTADNVKLLFNNTVKKQIELFDLNGQLLISQISTNDEEIISLDNYNSGVYYLKVTNTEINQTVKIVKL